MPLSGVLICLIVGIADGDTLTARCGEPCAYEQIKVRIAGIDAPEKSQPFGQSSRQALADLCQSETAAIRPATRDKYGRMVADVQCDGRDAGETQVEAGMAWVFDKYSSGYEHLYPKQDKAKADQHGLWTDPNPVPPWEWRQQRRSSARQ